MQYCIESFRLCILNPKADADPIFHSRSRAIPDPARHAKSHSRTALQNGETYLLGSFVSGNSVNNQRGNIPVHVAYHCSCADVLMSVQVHSLPFMRINLQDNSINGSEAEYMHGRENK
jgi:hypothetical protein